MTKILIPTDFSDHAQNAIDYAIYFFEKEPCTFYILHAHVIVPSAAETRTDAENHLKRIVQKLEENKGECAHHFEWLLIADIPISAVNASLIDLDIDYLFMGTRGRTAFSEIFMGRTAIDIIKHVPSCPIFAVPSEILYIPPTEIFFATDYKRPLQHMELEPILKVCRLWLASINVIHLKTEKELTETQVLHKLAFRNHLKEITHRFIEVKTKSSFSTALGNLVEENKQVGLLVLMNTKHSFLEELLRAPTLKKVVFSSKIPLLLLPVMD